jgi:hypothetical protein
VSNFDVEEWQTEAEQEEDTVFVGRIPGIAIVRELLENSAEINNLHICTSSRDAELNAIAARSGTGTIIQDEFSKYNYTESFTATSACLRYECAVCYTSVQVFKRPRILLLGAPANHPKAVKLDKLHELKTYAKILSALEMLNAVTYPQQSYNLEEDIKENNNAAGAPATD